MKSDLTLRPWPLDWENHIIKAFTSYFSISKGSENITITAIIPLVGRYVAGDFRIDTSEVRIVFSLKGKMYSGSFIKTLSDTINCTLFFITNIEENGEIVKFDFNFIEVFEESEVIEIIKKSENIIWRHFWGRGDNDGDNGNDSPIFPNDPNLINTPPELINS